MASKPLTYSPPKKKTPAQLAAEKENARVKAERKQPGGRPSEKAMDYGPPDTVLRRPTRDERVTRHDGPPVSHAPAQRASQPGAESMRALREQRDTEATVKVLPEVVAATADARLDLASNHGGKPVSLAVAESVFADVDIAFARIGQMLSHPMTADALATMHRKLAALKREGGVLDTCAKHVKEAIAATLGPATSGMMGRYSVAKNTSYKKPVPEDLVRAHPNLKLSDVANELITWEYSEAKVAQLIAMGTLTQAQVDEVRKVHAVSIKVEES